MAKSTKNAVNRRGFLKGAATAAAGAAAIVTTAPNADLEAQTGQRGAGAPANTAAPPPTAEQIDRDAGNVQPGAARPANQRAAVRPGSDLMVQVLKDLGIEYVAGNPGSSFEGLQESIINYGTPPNHMPEFITALHEESAVTMAQVQSGNLRSSWRLIARIESMTETPGAGCLRLNVSSDKCASTISASSLDMFYAARCPGAPCASVEEMQLGTLRRAQALCLCAGERALRLERLAFSAPSMHELTRPQPIEAEQ